MQSKEKENMIFVRLFPDEVIHEKLKEICEKHEVKTAVVLSGIGQLKNFQLGYFKEKGNYMLEEFEKPHELLSLSGNIIEQEGSYKLHLHATLGNENKEVKGGHLARGEVEVTNEIVVMKSKVEVKRKLEEATGLEGIYLE